MGPTHEFLRPARSHRSETLRGFTIVSLKRLLIPLITALAVMFSAALMALPARADSNTDYQAAAAKAADWIAQEWANKDYGRGDTGMVADGVIALASANSHRDIANQMLAALQMPGAGDSYSSESPDKLAKIIMTAAIGGVADPAHFLGKDRDLVAELIRRVEAKEDLSAWGGYLAVIALSRTGHLGQLSDAGMDYLMANMMVTADGGFGWSAGAPKGDPDYTGLGISAMLLLSKDQSVEQTYRDQATAALTKAIAWTQNSANQFSNGDGDVYWGRGSSANSSGMIASALAEAGVNTENAKKNLLKEQAATDSKAAWSNIHMDASDDIRATVQAIMGVTGVGYATAGFPKEQPLKSAKPTIVGTAKAGVQLTAEPGDWDPEATLTYQWRGDGDDLKGATGEKFTPATDNVDMNITVAVTGKRDGYATTTVESDATDNVIGADLKTTKPTISGTPQVGRTLTASTEGWTPGTKFEFQWTSDGKNIAGATDSTLLVGTENVGKTLAVKVTGSLADHVDATVASDPTKPVAPEPTAPTTTIKPTISGTPQVGKTLTVNPGTWPEGTTPTFQWLRDGQPIPDATNKTFGPGAATVGKKVTVKVTGTINGKPVSYTSPSTAAVKEGTLSAPTPKISGIAQVGKTLTLVTGTWTAGTSPKFQWYRNGQTISGATNATLGLGAGSQGKKITVKVTGRKSGFSTVTKTSAQTATVKAGTLSGATPKITGTTQVGKTLTANPGAWTSGTSLSYQWYSNGKAISKATSKTYKLATATRGKQITVKVTGRKSGYSTLNKTSAKTSTIR